MTKRQTAHNALHRAGYCTFPLPVERCFPTTTYHHMHDASKSALHLIQPVKSIDLVIIVKEVHIADL